MSAKFCHGKIQDRDSCDTSEVILSWHCCLWAEQKWVEFLDWRPWGSHGSLRRTVGGAFR